jgi:hypothetical protein
MYGAIEQAMASMRKVQEHAAAAVHMESLALVKELQGDVEAKMGAISSETTTNAAAITALAEDVSMKMQALRYTFTRELKDSLASAQAQEASSVEARLVARLEALDGALAAIAATTQQQAAARTYNYSRHSSRENQFNHFKQRT